jgi:hypothetical protein
MFSAVTIATFIESPPSVWSAAACSFASTYAASACT